MKKTIAAPLIIAFVFATFALIYNGQWTIGYTATAARQPDDAPISERFKVLYQQALATPYPKREIVDSLLHMANRSGNVQEQARSAVLNCRFYSMQQDEHQLNVAFEQAYPLVKQADYTEGLNMIYYDKAAFYRNTYQDRKSIIVAEEFLNEAERDNNHFGMQEAYHALGMAYLNTGMHDKAIENLELSTKQYPFTHQKGHLSEAYTTLGKRIPQHADSLFEKSLEMATSYRDTCQIYYFSLLALRRYLLSDRTLGANYYTRLYNKILNSTRYPEGFGPSEQAMMEAYYNLFRGDKQKAIDAFTGRVNNPKILANYRQILYQDDGDWENAYKQLLIYDELQEQEDREQVHQDIRDLSDRMQHEILQKEVDDNQLELEQLRLERERVELEEQQADARRQEAESKRLLIDAQRQRTQALAETYRLEAHEKEILAAQSRQQHRKTTTQVKLIQQERENHNRIVVTHIIITVAALLFLCTVLIIWAILHRRKNYAKTAELHSQLRAKRQEAINTDKVKDAFIHNMSLDIRQPLQGVLGLAQILCDPNIETTSEESEEYGEEIMHNINYMIAGIDDILNVSDLQSGNFAVVPSNNEIASICEAAVTTTRQHLLPGVHLVLDLDDLPEGYSCVVDPRRTQQVLATYISNAAKHTNSPAEGEPDKIITLRAALDGRPGFLTFSVTNPTQITDIKQIKQLFEGKEDHSYIDLSLCRTIAQKMEGHAWYDSRYTQGARFCFDIPLDLRDESLLDQFNSLVDKIPPPQEEN